MAQDVALVVEVLDLDACWLVRVFSRLVLLAFGFDQLVIQNDDVCMRLGAVHEPALASLTPSWANYRASLSTTWTQLQLDTIHLVLQDLDLHR